MRSAPPHGGLGQRGARSASVLPGGGPYPCECDRPSRLAWSAAVAVEMIHCALPCTMTAVLRRRRRATRPPDRATGPNGEALPPPATRSSSQASPIWRASGAPPVFRQRARYSRERRRRLIISGQALELDERVDGLCTTRRKTGRFFEAPWLAATAVDAPVEPFAKFLAGRAFAAYQLADDLADEVRRRLACWARRAGPRPSPTECGRVSPRARRAFRLPGAGALETGRGDPRCPGESDLRRFHRRSFATRFRRARAPS